MALQTTVNTLQACGVAGAFYDDSPKRVHNYNVKASGANPATVGYAFTLDTANEGSAIVGGAIANGFAGIMVNPTQYVRANGLADGLAVANNSVGELCTMGHIWVISAQAVTIGMQGQYNTTTGAIGAVAAGDAAAAGYALIPNSKFVFTSGSVKGMAVLQLS